jgi:hypothetical protein
MNVDESDSATGQPHYSFIRFDIDDWISDQRIDEVTLRLVVANTMKAAGPRSGEIWEVTPFTYDDLLVAAPAWVGQGPVSPDAGAVNQGEAVTWTLPASVVGAGTAVFLGVYPLSTDGVDYWKLNGADPPRLTIGYH